MILYKIVPSEKSITPQEYNGEYNGMKPLIKYEWLDSARLTKAHDMLFLNDTGLLDGTEEKDGAFWWLHDNGEWQKFVGDALLWGTHGEDNENPSLSLEECQARITYTKPLGAREPNIQSLVIGFDTPEEMMEYLKNN